MDAVLEAEIVTKEQRVQALEATLKEVRSNNSHLTSPLRSPTKSPPKVNWEVKVKEYEARIRELEENLEDNRGHRIDHNEFMKWKQMLKEAKEREDLAVADLNTQTERHEAECREWARERTKWEEAQEMWKERQQGYQFRIAELEALLAKLQVQLKPEPIIAVTVKPKEKPSACTTKSSAVQTDVDGRDELIKQQQQQLFEQQQHIGRLNSELSSMRDQIQILKDEVRRLRKRPAGMEENVDHQVLLMELAELRAILDDMDAMTDSTTIAGRGKIRKDEAWEHVMSCGILSSLVGVKQRTLALKQQYNR
jgi:chromosome segregation ATPase